MILVRGTPGDSEDASRVVFTEADVAQVKAKMMRTWSRPPTAVELRRGFAQYIRNEILYREALARNLDRADPTVQLAMVRKITMMGTAQAEAAELTDEEIQAYFSLRKERYRIPARVNLMQVYLSKDKRGDSAQADTAQLLESFKQREPQPGELAGLGDSSMLESVFAEMSEQDLDRTFGGQFGAAVLALTPGQWSGPVESGYGLHLLKVTHRKESRIPDLTEVGQRVIADMRYEGRKAAEDQLYAEIAPRYQVLYDKAARAVLEGGDR
jgi:peptidyl-prolyl cis-trans isomerase C